MRVQLLLLVVIGALVAPAMAVTPVPLKADTPVLHEGRVKPLDSVARAILREVYGAENFKKIPATEWLINTISDPRGANKSEIIRIRSQEVKSFYGLGAAQKYFSPQSIGESLLEHQDSIEVLLNASDDSLQTALIIGLWLRSKVIE